MYVCPENEVQELFREKSVADTHICTPSKNHISNDMFIIFPWISKRHLTRHHCCQPCVQTQQPLNWSISSSSNFPSPSHSSLRSLVKSWLPFLPEVLRWLFIVPGMKFSHLALLSEIRGHLAISFSLSSFSSYSSPASFFLSFCMLLEHVQLITASGFLFRSLSLKCTFCSSSHGCFFLIIWVSCPISHPQRGCPGPHTNQTPTMTRYSSTLFSFLS